ncbi:MAG: ABC-F family ATP-binding cassette domain-containing protein [Methylotenera sp.]|nr:ABC-F family ATP-binding cassette domain-containing protein [Oligoflexia bacterium]
MLHLINISKQYGSKTLFENAEAHLNHRSRVALIGPNGAGKSTLIKIILGQESADSGNVTRVKHLVIGHLAQEVPRFEGRTILEEVMRLDGRREGLLKARIELEEKLSHMSETTTDAAEKEQQQDLERYGRVLEELEQLDEYRLEAKAKEILTGMGFAPKDFDRSLKEFSGGWLMRVALSRVLLMDPDLLLLDEPTNHLDLESILWLEEFLKSYRGAMLLVSHDTAFLNRMVTEVLEIDQKKVFSYRGNLDSYAVQKSERLTVLRAQHAGQQAKIAELQSFVDRFGAKATKARQAQSRVKQIEKMDLIELPEERSNVRFRFPPAIQSGKEVLTLKNASVRFGEKTIFKDLSWVIPRGARVAIVGVNGAGKTTLLKLLGHRIEAAAGEVKEGHNVKLGYYAQMQAETLDSQKTIIQELEQTAPEMGIAQVRAIAGAFLFSGDTVEKKCGVLSGGEKARVALAKLLLAPSNFLLLDEPTNHLDVESRGVLLDALRGYEGTLCLVSHDREFISPLVDSVLEIQPTPGGSRVIPLLGGYEDYLQKKVLETREKTAQKGPQKAPAKASLAAMPEVAPPVSSSKLNSAPASQFSSASASVSEKTAVSNNQRRAWEQERDKIEKEISQAESRQSVIHDLLADDSVYDDQAKLNALLEEQKALEKNLHSKLSRWEELSHLL